MAENASQIVAEILGVDVSFIRVSQIVVEATAVDVSFIRVTQLVTEVAAVDTSTARVSQIVTEVLGFLQTLRCSQLVLEILILNLLVPIPPPPGPPPPGDGPVALVYPDLIGLGYSVFKRPIFKTGVSEATSLREARIGYAQNNIWEWDLSYDYLPDMQANGTTATDLKTLMGFFLASHGGLFGFLFTDPDDHAIVGQGIAVTDGTTNTWQLCRNFGWGTVSPSIVSETPFEPVGFVNLTKPFTVYFDGVPIDPSTYDVVTTDPYNQLLRMHSTPTAGVTVTVDMSYYFYVRFKDDQYDFEKFVNQIWLTKKVTLRSLKGA